MLFRRFDNILKNLKKISVMMTQLSVKQPPVTPMSVSKLNGLRFVNGCGRAA